MSEDQKNDEEPTGKAKGGVARAAALTPAQRRSIAIKAAAARWGKLPRATHKGSFKEEFGIDVDCYVLDDEGKTAVISQRGMATAIGLDQSSGAALPRFLSGQRMAPYVGGELGEKLANPLIFQWEPVGVNTLPPTIVKGYDVTILIDICKAILKAERDGKLQKQQAHLAIQAQVIVNASAKAGIKGLAYALAGYDPTREEVIAAFKLYVREEARDYEREFPPALYDQWYRLYRLPRPDKNRPWKFKHLTVGHVYIPLARSNGKILEMTRTKRAESGDRRSKLHQFLSEVGVKALRTHLGQLLGIAQISDTQEQYEKNVEKVFGRQRKFDF